MAMQLLNLKEILELLSGTRLEVVRLSQSGRMSGKNYQLRARHPEGDGADAWAEYRTMEEMHHCPVFRWAMEEAREAMHPHDARLFLVMEFLAEPAFQLR